MLRAEEFEVTRWVPLREASTVLARGEWAISDTTNPRSLSTSEGANLQLVNIHQVPRTTDR